MGRRKRYSVDWILPERRNNILSYELTPEEDAAMVAEFRGNPRLFIESYMQIKNKKGQVVPFRLNIGQLIIYNQIIADLLAGRPVRLIILKARQLGASTLVEAILFWRALLWPNTDCIVVSHDTESAIKIFKMAQRFHDRMPKNVQPLKRYGTRRQFVFENPDDDTRAEVPGLQSSIQIATARNKDVGASMTLAGGHLSELARWEKAEEAMLSLQQAIPEEPNTIVVIESTAQGEGGHFYDLWKDAVDGKNSWTPIFLPFWIDPQYEMDLTEEEESKKNLDPPLDRYEKSLMEEFSPCITLRKLKWRRWMIVNKCGNSKIKFDQEYAPTSSECFAAQGTSIFDKEAVDFFVTNTKAKGRTGYLYYGPGERILFEEHPNGPLTVWRPPHKLEDYVIGADTALGPRGEEDADIDRERRESKGKKRDYYAACVLSAHREQVAELRSDMFEPFEFAEAIMMLGRWYNTALIFPETGNQGGGWAVGKRLQGDYPRIGVTERYDQTTKKMTKIIGWEAKRNTIPILMAEMMEEVRRGAGLIGREQCGDKFDMPRLQIRSAVLLGEMSTFVLHENGKLGAKYGAHDDTVRALGLGLLALFQIPEPVDLKKIKIAKPDASWYDPKSGISNAVTNGGFPSWLMS